MTTGFRTYLRKSQGLMVLMVAAVTAVLGVSLTRLPTGTVTLEVDLQSSTSGTIEIFTTGGGSTHHDYQGVRTGDQVLEFMGVPSPLSSIRVDPIANRDVEVTVKRVTVRGADGRVLFEATGTALGAWADFNVTVVEVSNAGLTLHTKTEDPAINTLVNIPSDGGSPWVDAFVQHIKDPWSAVTLLVGLPALALTAGFAVRRLRAAVVLLVGPIAVLAAACLAGSTRGITPASSALGQSGYRGFDAGYGQRFLTIAGIITVVSVAICLIVAGQLGFPSSLRRLATTKRLGACGHDDLATEPDASAQISAERDADNAFESLSGTDPPAADPSKPSMVSILKRLGRSRFVAVLLVPMLYAAITMPSARDLTQSLTRALPAQDWDAGNIVTWDRFYALGLTPMRDFWYPYGNLIVLRAGLLGHLTDWIGQVLCLTALSAGLLRMGQRRWPALAATAAVAVLSMEFFTGGLRYLCPLALIVWFAAERRSGGVARWFAVGAIAVSPFLALDLGIYALVGALSVVLVDELGIRGTVASAGSRRRLLTDAAVIASGWAAMAAVFALQGRLSDTVSFVLNQKATTPYVAAVVPVSDSLSGLPSALLFIGPFGFLGVSLYACLRRVGRVDGGATAALAGLGAYGVLVLAKDLIRPGLEGILAMICITGVGVALSGTHDRISSRWRSTAGGILIGTLIIQAVSGGWTGEWTDSIRSFPGRIGQLVQAATTERTDTPLFRAPLGSAQLAEYPDEVAAADEILRVAGDGRAFVLSGSQFLYPLTNSRPYWAVSIYDVSPLTEQRHVLRLLAADPPAVVAIQRNQLVFDGVPNVLRAPLLYSWAVADYRFETTSGPYDLLTKRAFDEPIDWQYWRGVLGQGLDLGRLSAATSSHLDRCDVVGDDCVAYASISVEPVDATTTRILSVSGPSGQFTLTLTQEPEDRTLRVPVGRLWFWTDGSAIDKPDWAQTMSVELRNVRNALY